MREIKFRGQSDETGKMERVGKLRVGFSDTDEAWAALADDTTIFSLETVTQFTGLKDGKGVEIYEGDILVVRDLYKEIVCDDGSGPTEDFAHLAPVVYDDARGTFGVDIAAEGCCYSGYYDPGFTSFEEIEQTTGLETLEVIGNVYENPDLVKVTT